MVAVLVAGWFVLAALVVAAWPKINADKAWRTGALTLTLAFSLLHQLLFRAVADDAYVTFRYALHIADGRGAVFNTGERVEGYGSFLWMVLLSLLKTVFGADIVTAASVLGVLCTLAAVVVAFVLVNRIVAAAGRDEPALGVAAAVLTAGAGGLAAHGTSGTETGLFVLLVLSVALALACRRPVVGGVLVALAVMTRPDGFVFALVAVAWLLVSAARGRSSWWAPGAFALGALVLVVPWTAWRVTYYGHLVPDSIAVRLGRPVGDQLAAGWHYLSGFSLVHQGFLLLALGAVAALAGRRGAKTTAAARSLVWLVLAAAIGFVAGAVAIGGEAVPAWRLLAPVPPLLAVAAAAACGLLAKDGEETSRRTLSSRRVVPAVALGLCGVSLVVSVESGELLPRIDAGRARTADLAVLGSWLGERLPPGSVIATYGGGPLAYWAGTGVVVIDELGRTDDHIARKGTAVTTADGPLKVDHEYVVNLRSPLLAVSAEGFTPRQRCAMDPVYAGRYQVATFKRTGTNQWVALYPRSELAARFIADLDADPRFDYLPCPG
ncbi:hypothetical protein [Amycolatopsis sp. CA-230715]|uniref:hypothetical protein n=1 Tax=Amycolatopsis sp. CA-230715 TaxID=2745196 RepID=UPI001C00DC86|nr:hypothetical protein [Amycolatopsis sp. CA-230715]QWF80210.1 hypothetical protein HUW46_03629 [Amycolatopsis sp. CA-230715]